jgi:hypothetical protein
VILIAGDSYSDSAYVLPDGHMAKDCWTHQLEQEYKIENRAKRGVANLDILRSQIQTYTGPAIVNLSSLVRLPLCGLEIINDGYFWDGREDELDKPIPSRCVQREYQMRQLTKKQKQRVYKANTTSARRMITQLTGAYFWSPFPEYEQWTEVDYVPITWGNTMYNKRLPDEGNHLTSPAHSWLTQHMRDVINERWS